MNRHARRSAVARAGKNVGGVFHINRTIGDRDVALIFREKGAIEVSPPDHEKGEVLNMDVKFVLGLADLITSETPEGDAIVQQCIKAFDEAQAAGRLDWLAVKRNKLD